MSSLRAEWTKLRTTPGTIWLLAAVVGSTIAVSYAAAATVTCHEAFCPVDATKLSLTGIYCGQTIVAIIGVLIVGNEYSTGMIGTTLAAMPNRTVVLLAKAAATVVVVFPAAGLAVAGSLAGGRLVGTLTDSLMDSEVLRAGVGSVLYLLLIALLSIGIATAVRNPAAAIGIVLGLLYLFPIVVQVVSDPDWQRHLQQLGPMTAGFAIQATVDLEHLPISPWHGLGVVALWALASLGVGALLLNRRDA